MIYLFGPPRQIVCDEATEFTSTIVQAIVTMLNCRLKVIGPYNHGSGKCKRQIKMISEIIVKHLWDKGQMWPLFSTTAAYTMNTFASEALSGFSPFQLIFLRDPLDLTSLSFPKIDTIPANYHEYYNLLLARAQMIGRLLLEWGTQQALEYEKKTKQYTKEEIFQDDQIAKCLNPDYAKNFLPVSLFLGYSVAACICCPKCALVLRNGSERFCASRPLLGSYVHQESMLNKM